MWCQTVPPHASTSLPVEYPAALEAGDGDPIRLASEIRDGFAFLPGYSVHMGRDWFRPDC
jgi:hypothetical protein